MKNIFRLLFVVFWLFTTMASLYGQWIQTGLKTAIADLAISGTNIFVVTVDSSTFPVVNGVFLSTNNGTSWRAASTTNLTSAYVGRLAVSGANIFAGAEYGVFLSTNNGTSWSSTDFPNDDVTALAVSGTNIFANSYEGGVYLSTNNGISWTNPYTQFPYHYVAYAFAISGTNIFSGGNGGVYLSINNGATWGAVNTGLTNVNVSRLAVSGTNIFAGTDGGVFLSTNNGKSWNVAGLTNTYYSAWVLSLGASGTNLFAGIRTGGVFLSTNNGTSWSAVGLSNTLVNSFAFSGANIFAGTDSGLYRRPLTEMITTVNKSKSEIPASFSLSQNYPNPFNPSTTISFSLPSRSFVTLKIFDMLGKEVTTIVSGEMSSGNYTKQWDAAIMSSGIYFYRLQAGSFTETKKLILLR